jgi:hypothetical protein
MAEWAGMRMQRAGASCSVVRLAGGPSHDLLSPQSSRRGCSELHAEISSLLRFPSEDVLAFYCVRGLNFEIARGNAGYG